MKTDIHSSHSYNRKISFQILAFIWIIAAIVLTISVFAYFQNAFPLFTFVMLLMLLGTLTQTRNVALLGFCAVPLKDLTRYTVLCLLSSLSLMAVVEPWSHTYQQLFLEAISSSQPDSTFGWLIRYPGMQGWAGFILYGGFVTLFAEEVFFRGLVLNWLKRKIGEWKAVFLQAALFTIPQLLAAFLLPPLQGFLYASIYSWLAVGIVNGWAASCTNSIWPGLISAVLYNTIMTVFSL